MNFFAKFVFRTFLSKYKDADYITQKKAQFFVYFDLIFISALIFMTLFFAAVSYERFMNLAFLTLPSILITAVCLFLLKKGKITLSINMMAVLAAIIMAMGFITRPPYLAGVSLAYFMYLTVIFTTLFCSISMSTIITLSFIGTHIYYFFYRALPVVKGNMYEASRTSMVDGIIVLIMVYVVGIIAMRIMNQAIQKSREESEKNLQQYSLIQDLFITIQEASIKLTDSIDFLAGIISNYSTSSQQQAASVEELGATVEEISAGAESVMGAAKEQDQSIVDLAESINVTSLSIDKLEIYGKEIANLFQSFLKLSEGGEHSSSLLDSTNSKIMENSNNILSVTTIIEDFFDKINLLSLNATIEAARAGEHGKGFAVVAEEIGKLADNSAQELKSITTLIAKNREDVEEGNKTISEIIEFLNTIAGGVRNMQEQSVEALKEIKKIKRLKDDLTEKTITVKEKSEVIKASMTEQSTAMEEAVKSIEDTNILVQKNAENTVLLQNNSENMKKLALELNVNFKKRK